ncbi:hypothetical protein G7054_g14676 [Neopestalotiopsis clavispora]|nr:hypothetical protein G7054_g14676 [Neopestalotiopsis clavispora]
MAEPSETVPFELAERPTDMESSTNSDDSDAQSAILPIRKRGIEEETEKQETAEKAREEARKNLKRDRILELAEKHFHSHAGIIYVSDEMWMGLWTASGPCHIYVALQKFDVAMPEVQPPAFLPDKGHPLVSKLAGLPPRFKIVNEILHRDMIDQREIHGGSSTLSHDNVAPFRSIIPYEKAFRQRHIQTEEAFSEMAKEAPNHFAVLRQELDWVPISEEIAFEVDYSPVHVDYIAMDNVVEARLLRDGYRALIHLLDHELCDLVQDYRRIQDRTIEKLPFLHLWHLFEPGQEIVAQEDECQAYRVLQVTGGRKLHKLHNRHPGAAVKRPAISNLVIDCFHLDFDGKEAGPIPVTITIKPYEGLKDIRKLAAYPLALAADSNLSHMLTERGKKFVDGDVMVDFKLAYRSNERLRRIEPLQFRGGVIDEPTDEDVAETEAFDNLVDDVRLAFDDPRAIREQWFKWSHETQLLEKRSPDALTDECYNLFPARVWGYVFLRRKWYPLNISLLESAQMTESAQTDSFDKLVLPSGHKKIVRALVRTHAKRAAAMSSNSTIPLRRDFDIVKGKGRGLIILLHGAPGVGKTSTAECVAANAGKPLFPITIGDVGGESAVQVEQNLEKYFDLARKWNCVLLLDEADVFLGTRVDGNIAQNSLVSVFLRALEYYSGILILTTNRVGSFDEAIKSRVHCALYYPPLDKDQTIKIWQMNIKLLQERNDTAEPGQRIRFNPTEIEEYALHHWKKGKRENRWNGRQIKNAFQTAVALADYETLSKTDDKGNPRGPTFLEQHHFEKVAEASEHFDMYLEKTRMSDHQRAREGAIREDNITFIVDGDSDSDDETESEVETKKKKKKGSKKSSAKKSKSSKDKASKSKKKRKEEYDEESTEESGSEESTS